jgi:hypothetical protein
MKKSPFPHSILCYVPYDNCSNEEMQVFHVTPGGSSNSGQPALKVEDGNYLALALERDSIKNIYRIFDQDGAIERLNQILTSRNDFTASGYSLQHNNCEQFVNYVATGNRISESWQTVKTIATASVIAAITLWGSNERRA